MKHLLLLALTLTACGNPCEGSTFTYYGLCVFAGQSDYTQAEVTEHLDLWHSGLVEYAPEFGLDLTKLSRYYQDQDVNIHFVARVPADVEADGSTKPTITGLRLRIRYTYTDNTHRPLWSSALSHELMHVVQRYLGAKTESNAHAFPEGWWEPTDGRVVTVSELSVLLEYKLDELERSEL